MGDVVMSVRDLRVSFVGEHAVEAIRGVSFDLERGRTTALVGESGCGKSVTARALLGVMGPQQRITGGSILLTGDGPGGRETVDLATLDERRRRADFCGRRVAMVFQDALNCLDPTMSVGRQIMEGLRRHLGLSRADARRRAVELLDEVGIDQPERRFRQYPHQLSGGMCQRVTIAIALSCDPDVLICDEPTTALDVTIQLRILDLIRRLQERRGLSVLFITHDLGVVAAVADTVNVMYAGRVVEQGSAEDVFYRPRHPYTWGLLSAMPDLGTAGAQLDAIPGSPPDLAALPPGDPFAPRNPYALAIDLEEEPPMFDLGDGHRVASWLCHPDAPEVEMPGALRSRIAVLTGAGDAR
jgi:oligopeptide transport system ATP-binding protein